MYFLIISLSVLLLLAIALVIKFRHKIKVLVKENNSLKESFIGSKTKLENAVDTADNSIRDPHNTDSISFKNSELKEKVELLIEDTIDVTETIHENVAVEFLPNEIKNKQQHYYIVKEIKINKKNDSIVSTTEYEFANQDLYTSKVESRLFYDNKISTHSNKDEISVAEYELYIVNNVFYDVINTTVFSNDSTNGIKRYLLIDNKGIDQLEGRNFETFALRAVASRMNKRNAKQVNHISTKNSFLDGDYKD